MAFRTAGYWKSMVRSFGTSTSPKLKPYSPTADHTGNKSKLPKGDFFPVFVAVGMICLSASFGVYTVCHQLGKAPNVFLKKSRRETIPEVVEPDRVAHDAERFVKNSFFRKITHIQDFDRQEVMPDPIRADVFTRPVHVESLKDVGVDPLPH